MTTPLQSWFVKLVISVRYDIVLGRYNNIFVALYSWCSYMN